jgi:hypothetical protein
MIPEVFLSCMEYSTFYNSFAGKNEIEVKDLREVITFDGFPHKDQT